MVKLPGLNSTIYDDQLSCLSCVHRHLRTGGRLAFNVFFPSLEFIASNTGSLGGGWRWTEDVPLPDGGKLVRSEANRYDTVQPRVSSRHRFERFDTSGVLVSTHIQELELAYLFPGDIHRLLSDVGFEEIEILGGFDEREFSQDVEELVVRARRP